MVVIWSCICNSSDSIKMKTAHDNNNFSVILIWMLYSLRITGNATTCQIWLNYDAAVSRWRCVLRVRLYGQVYFKRISAKLANWCSPGQWSLQQDVFVFADLPSSVVAVPEFPQLVGCGQFLRKDYDHQMNILSTPRMCRMLDVGCVIVCHLWHVSL